MLEFHALAQRCAPAVHPTTMAAMVQVESTFNPFAIGVVGGQLRRQPRSLDEAVATAKSLAASGYNFSLGIGQINRHNLLRYGLDYQRAFDACANLHAASRILKACFDHAKTKGLQTQRALHAAFSCYYSGDFATGFQTGVNGRPAYVQQVLNSAAALANASRTSPGTAKFVVQPPVDHVPSKHRATRSNVALVEAAGVADRAVMVYR